MKVRRLTLAAVCCALLAGAGSIKAQGYYDPPGVSDALGGLSSQRAAAITITFDREMLDAMLGGDRAAGFNGVSFEHYQYPEPVFYIPEEMHALEQAYHAAGWSHLIDSQVGPRESASPTKPVADIWFHWQGGEIMTMPVQCAAPMKAVASPMRQPNTWRACWCSGCAR